MEIFLNQQQQRIAEDQTLADLLDQQPPAPPFAVAINGQFVAKPHYANTPLQGQDRIDILSPIQGG